MILFADQLSVVRQHQSSDHFLFYFLSCFLIGFGTFICLSEVKPNTLTMQLHSEAAQEGEKIKPCQILFYFFHFHIHFVF